MSTGREIVFRAYNKNNKRQQPIKISPCEDATGKLYTGQGKDGYFEHLTDNDKNSMSYVIDRFTKVTIQDGKTLYLDNPIDAANWKWISGNKDSEFARERKGHHPYIAMDKEAGYALPSASFYIENRSKDAEKRVSTSKLRDKARYLIQYELSYDAQVRVAKVLGHPAAESFSPIVLTDYLLNLAETIPNSIIDAADPDKAEQSGIRAVFHELVRYNVIAKYKGGVYKFGGHDGDFVGHNETKVEEFMANPKNQDKVEVMMSILEENKSRVADNKTGILS